jgi:RimJ/RimL family protein N-acetyltransferase
LGRGYYGETFAELTRLGFDRLDLELTEIVHARDNEKSRRATEKFVERFGGRHEGLLRRSEVADREAGGALDVHRYTISRDEFEANRPGSSEPRWE